MPLLLDLCWIRRLLLVTTGIAVYEGGIDIAGEDECSLFVDKKDDGYRKSNGAAAAATASGSRSKIVSGWSRSQTRPILMKLAWMLKWTIGMLKK